MVTVKGHYGNPKWFLSVCLTKDAFHFSIRAMEEGQSGSWRKNIPSYHPVQLYSYVSGTGNLGEVRVRKREREWLIWELPAWNWVRKQWSSGFFWVCALADLYVYLIGGWLFWNRSHCTRAQWVIPCCFLPQFSVFVPQQLPLISNHSSSVSV